MYARLCRDLIKMQCAAHCFLGKELNVAVKTLLTFPYLNS